MATEKTKKTVLVVTGSRAEYGLLRPVIRELQKSKTLTPEVLVTGQHTLHTFGFSQQLIEKDSMPIVSVVSVEESDSMLTSLSKEIAGIEKYCMEKKPDLILINGDRDESFAGAIVGGHLGIPVGHIHGGDKTGYVVDEYIRHATTKFSHLHFAATKKSAKRIQQLGEEPWRVFITGGPGLDELHSLRLPTSKEIATRYNLSMEKRWCVVLQHQTPLDTTSYQEQMAPLLSAVNKLDGEKIILYPNSDTGSAVFITEIEKYKHDPSMHIYKNIPREDLIAILKRATLLLGNSSMGIIDASFLRLPVVNIGNRQQGRERGANVVDSGYSEAEIIEAISKAEKPAFRKKVLGSKSPYGDGTAAKKIVQYIEQNIDRPDLFYKKLTYL